MWGLGLRHLMVEYVNYNQDTPVANTGICTALESMITESTLLPTLEFVSLWKA